MKKAYAIILLAAMAVVATEISAQNPPLYFTLAVDFYHELKASPEPDHLIGCAVELAGLVSMGISPDAIDCDDVHDWYYGALQIAGGDVATVLRAMGIAIRIYSWSLP